MKRSRSSAALRVAAVGVEAVADDRAAVAHDVGDERDDGGGHLAEVDIGVAMEEEMGTVRSRMSTMRIW